MEDQVADDPLLIAAIELIGRTGAKNIQIRYTDDPEPTVWIADAEWDEGRLCGSGFTPVDAAFDLCENAIDGGVCKHCHRPTAVTGQWEETLPLAKDICWYVYDPEMKKFRRSCEGE